MPYKDINKRRECAKNWAKNNPERTKERTKNWHKIHHKEFSEYHKKWYQDNKIRIEISRKERSNINREKIIEYLLYHPCIDCGETDIRCLEFDHVRGQKLFNISRLTSHNGGYSWEVIENEIKKCEVRCRNCHAIKTHEEVNSYKSQYLKERN